MTRLTAAIALLALLILPHVAHATSWLLFPVDVTRYKKFTSPFGSRILQRHTEHHQGIDLAAPKGSAVIAAREGTIVRIDYDKRAGWYVKIEHPFGWHTVYCHLREDPRRYGLKVGMSVRAAQPIARVGSTGRSTAPHLHFAVIDPSGRYVDPVPHVMTPLDTYRVLYSGSAE